MKLTVLCDNNTITDLYLTGEPALSFFIEEPDKKILFDTGYSGVFIKNAEDLGINLLLTDYIVLSHGHRDHTGGLLELKKFYLKAKSEGIQYKRPCIIAHPQVFRDISDESFGNIGSPLELKDAEEFADVILTAVPYKVTENLTFLGEIQSKVSFESPSYSGVSLSESGQSAPDCSPDDSALVFSGKNGIVVITGCSHSGICAIAEEAKKVSGRDDFLDIIGGFHLLGTGEDRLVKTGEFLRDLGLNQIHPCHCTDFAARNALSRYLGVTEVGCGFVIEF